MELKRYREEDQGANTKPNESIKEQPMAPVGKKKVLIIDDDPDYCWMLQTILENEGYEVCCAMTGLEGLELAVTIKPDLIVLDIMMENPWAGYEINQALKFQSGYESLNKVPIIMVSSVEQPPAQRFFKSVDSQMISPDIYFTKPIETKRFMETVRSFCPLS
jgi:CheY-like chemotaxis protein